MRELDQKVLDLGQEEAAEIIQIISKIRRFGLDSYHPDDEARTTNQVLLQRELGDLLAIAKLLDAARVIDLGYVEEHADRKAAWLQDRFESGKIV